MTRHSGVVSSGRNPGGQASMTLPARRRSGFTIVELTIALMLVLVCWGMVAPFMVQLGRQRRQVHREQQALLAASNVIDELTQCPLDELQARIESVQQRMQQQLAHDFPGTIVIVKDDALSQDVPGRSVVCQIRWNDERGQPVGSVVMTGWNLLTTGGVL